MKQREAEASVEQLKKDIAGGELKRFYLLYGSERYLRNFYEKKLLAAMGGQRDDMNTNIFDTNPVATTAVIDQALTMPFFADRRIVVVRYSGFFDKSTEDLADFLAEAPETTSFIFVEDTADARLKLYKQVAKLGLVVEFTTQSDRYLLQNIGAYLKKNEKRISQEDARYMLDVIGTDMGKLMAELDKLVCYCLDKDVITREDIDTICSRSIEDRIFEMIDAVMKKDIKTCLDRYEDLLALKVAPSKIVMMLEKQLLWMLQIKSLMDAGQPREMVIENVASNREVDPVTGEIKKTRGAIGEWQAGIYYRQAQHMTMSELQRAVLYCATADEDFKTGRMNERSAAETLMVKLCKLK